MIQIKNISRTFENKVVLNDFSHTFPDRGCFVITGPSGCGKTTLLRLLAGLDHPNTGEIISTARHVAMSFQEPRLLPWFTALKNLKLVMQNNEKKAMEWLRAMEMEEAANALPHTLSGGMQQRLNLARALSQGADLILLDEPFTGLDNDLKMRIIPMIKAANKNGLTLVVTHSMTEAEFLGAEILTLTDGNKLT